MNFHLLSFACYSSSSRQSLQTALFHPRHTGVLLFPGWLRLWIRVVRAQGFSHTDSSLLGVFRVFEDETCVPLLAGRLHGLR